MRQHTHNWGSDSDMETLAAIARVSDTPGLNFARASQHEGSRKMKDDARSQVLSALSPAVWPGSLSILTMPGVQWRFERLLLKKRETEEALVNGKPRRTFITAIEREAPIYTAALLDIPGWPRGIKHLPGDLPLAGCSLRTEIISRFHLMKFEEFAAVSKADFGAAWLDFTGPLTIDLLEAVRIFWPHVRRRFTVTFLDARYCKRVGARLNTAGGAAALLQVICPNSTLIKDHKYQDGVPMRQVTLKRQEEM